MGSVTVITPSYCAGTKNGKSGFVNFLGEDNIRICIWL